jgi:hypothetical protein
MANISPTFDQTSLNTSTETWSCTAAYISANGLGSRPFKKEFLDKARKHKITTALSAKRINSQIPILPSLLASTVRQSIDETFHFHGRIVHTNSDSRQANG